ncbi:hypothetical protein [Myroides odoratus]|uniref:Uncharacterized protein n=1 Tax=Myroides odoratus TaxID=256 RepID=A0A378RKD8_MYROD|nr:hypothetical protein [Myroides odoratus]QQU05060.1 hypothetical protein I6I89_07195 [Myroides odoratus]STZ27464.1 Uncharacterised protein [Myroides odoratus]
MKKLMLMGAFLLSVGTFAQSGIQSADTKSIFAEYEKQGYVQVDATTAYNRQFDCWIGVVLECDECGNPKDFLDSNVRIVVTSYSQSGIAAKQSEYCETGTISVLRDCEPRN